MVHGLRKFLLRYTGNDHRVKLDNNPAHSMCIAWIQVYPAWSGLGWFFCVHGNIFFVRHLDASIPELCIWSMTCQFPIRLFGKDFSSMNISSLRDFLNPVSQLPHALRVPRKVGWAVIFCPSFNGFWREPSASINRGWTTLTNWFSLSTSLHLAVLFYHHPMSRDKWSPVVLIPNH